MAKRELADRYAELREKKGLNQAQLSKELGINAKTISFYENDIQEMPAKTVKKYAEYFNVSTDFLLGLTDDPECHPSAVDDLGLSPHTVRQIKFLSATMKLFDFTLGSDFFIDMLTSIDLVDFFSEIGSYDIDENIKAEMLRSGEVEMSPEKVIEYQTFKAQQALQKLIDQIIERGKKSAKKSNNT